MCDDNKEIYCEWQKMLWALETLILDYTESDKGVRYVSQVKMQNFIDKIQESHDKGELYV